jgi:hypothetical protein
MSMYEVKATLLLLVSLAVKTTCSVRGLVRSVGAGALLRLTHARVGPKKHGLGLLIGKSGLKLRHEVMV